ncbi:MAG: hypothetical protein AAF960_14490 [Bacteroidota bacterium]
MLYDRLILLLTENRTQEVLRQLMPALVNSNHQKDLIRVVQLSSRFSELEERRKLKVQSEKDMSPEYNELRVALAELLLDLKTGELEQATQRLDTVTNFPPTQLVHQEKQYRDIAEWLYKNRVRTATNILKQLNIDFDLDANTTRKLTYEFINALILFSGVIGNNEIAMLDDPSYVFEFEEFYDELYPSGLTLLAKAIPEPPRITTASRTALLDRIQYFKKQLVSG